MARDGGRRHTGPISLSRLCGWGEKNARNVDKVDLEANDDSTLLDNVEHGGRSHYGAASQVERNALVEDGGIGEWHN